VCREEKRLSSGEAARPSKSAVEECHKRVANTKGKVYIKRSFFTKKRSEHEDHLPIMSLRRGKQGNRQRLSKNRNHALVLFSFARHAVYHVEAIEGRPIPGVSGVPCSERPNDEKKRMERI
jgi:hypothetical protein